MTHVRAIAQELDKRARERGVSPHAKDIVPDAKWAVLDFGDVVAHIFTAEAREFYNLEQLWGAAPVIRRQDSIPEGQAG